MSPTWHGTAPPPEPWRPRGGDWLRVLGRGLPVLVVILGGLVLTLSMRLIEAPMYRARRPWTPHVSHAVCRASLWFMGISIRIDGAPPVRSGAVVANHSTWLDILALNAAQRLSFVAKSEVASWPGIGWLARATGTLFVRRDRAEAAVQVAQLRARLEGGSVLCFFPEGTSSDGRRVLPFKAPLFAALTGAGPADMAVQPVSVIWQAPAGYDPRFYAWWGGMDLGPHLLGVLAVPRQGTVRVIRHPPLRVAGFAGRKGLAQAAEAAVRAPVEDAVGAVAGAAVSPP